MKFLYMPTGSVIKQTLSIMMMVFLLAMNTAFAAPANDSARVIVQFTGPVTAEDKAFVRGLGGVVTHEYSLVPAMALEVPEPALKGLANNPRVVHLEEDVKVRAMVMTPITDITDEYGETWSIENVQAKSVHDSGNLGAGVKIGIIDSGISNTHADLNVVGEYDFVNKSATSDDVYGHGTHIAGTACGVANGFGVVGTAPACELYDLRVLNDDGVGNTSDIIAAVDWAAANDLDIINLSLGSSRDPGAIAQAAYDAAYESGVLIVAAAGNSGNPRGKGNNTIYPANYSSVIAVAATDSNNNRAPFSSTGNNVEIAAPGASVHSAWNDANSYLDPQPNCIDPYGCYKDGSGTSMASPQVAGVAALIMAAGVQNNQDVRAILQDTATPLGDPKQYGAGLVNAEAAVSGIVISDDPVAHAGPDQDIVVAEGVTSTEVTLDGSGSYDQTEGGTIMSYEWFTDSVPVASGSRPTVTLPLGEHTITLQVTDEQDLTDEDTVVITVTESVAPDESTAFQVGDRVKTQGRLNVRDDADGALLGDHHNESGTVVGGPVYSSGYWWWNIDYDSDPDGWSVEKWLRKLK